MTSQDREEKTMTAEKKELPAKVSNLVPKPENLVPKSLFFSLYKDHLSRGSKSFANFQSEHCAENLKKESNLISENYALLNRALCNSSGADFLLYFCSVFQPFWVC